MILPGRHHVLVRQNSVLNPLVSTLIAMVDAGIGGSGEDAAALAVARVSMVISISIFEQG